MNRNHSKTGHLSTLAAIALFALLACGCAVVGDYPAARSAVRPPGPVFDAQVKLAGGTYEHDIDGSLEDRTSAGFIGLLAEGSSRAGFGGGVSLELMNSDDDLFGGPSVTPLQASSVEVNPFFLYRMRAGNRFRMPIRVGPWVHVLTLDDQGSEDSLSWISFGLRLAVEPEVVLAQTANFEFSLFTAISLAGGGTVAHFETATGDQDFDTSGGAFGFEFGPRFRWSHFFTSVSFLHRGLGMDESDPENNFVVLGFEDSFNALAFTFGGGF